MGNLLNGLIEKVITQWITSEAAKRYVSSAVMRWGSVLVVYLLARYGARYGLTDSAMKAIGGHWEAILGLAAPAIAAAAIEFASWAKAKLNAKALEIATQAPANALTPCDAKAAAKIALGR